MAIMQKYFEFRIGNEAEKALLPFFFKASFLMSEVMTKGNFGGDLRL